MDIGRFSTIFLSYISFLNILSYFVMLNFVAIRRGISTTPGTSALAS